MMELLFVGMALGAAAATIAAFGGLRIAEVEEDDDEDECGGGHVYTDEYPSDVYRIEHSVAGDEKPYYISQKVREMCGRERCGAKRAKWQAEAHVSEEQLEDLLDDN